MTERIQRGIANSEAARNILARMPPHGRPRRLLHCACAAAATASAWLFATGCSRPEPLPPALGAASLSTAAPVSALDFLQPQPIGTTPRQPPWIAHVTTVDLDRDGLNDILACEAQQNQVLWLRQRKGGGFDETVIGTDLKAPVHAEAADLDGDGDLDVVVASMGYVFPNNDRIGTLFILENDGAQRFRPRVVLERTSRITDARPVDLDGDGRLDLALAQFGYDQGEVSWLQRTGPWEYRRHVLLELSGAINVEAGDFNGDGKPDLVAIISQQWEEIHYFENTGGGFVRKRIWGSTNEDFGSSGLSVADLNRDGRPDVLFTSGDGFGPAATPGPRPWHGAHWLENTGGGFFRYHHLGALPGAYSPRAVDLDGDGAVDVVASAAYADWNNKNATVVSLMWFRNDGRMGFTPHVLAHAPKDQISVAVGQFNHRPALVTGGFYIYPPFDNMARVTVWQRR